MPETVGDLLRRGAADPKRSFAVLEDGTAITYAEQLHRSRKVAAGMHAEGARPGDRIHVQLANCPEFFDVWFATALSGTVLVPTNPQSSEDELAHVLEDAQPAISLRDPGQVRALSSAAVGDGEGWPPNRLSAILYTSGTTSRPKGVMVTDANYVAVGEALATQLSVTAADRWLVVLPLFHANAQYYCTMSALARGASIALGSRFSASGWSRLAREHGATLGSLFAAPVRMILAAPPAPCESDNQLRTVIYAQNLTDMDAGAFERRFDTRLVQLYGMTETILPPTMNPNDATRRWDSIGRPLPGVRVELIDDSGTVGPGTGIGEMRIPGARGQTLAAGYWRQPEATACTFAEDGLHTGDLARRDENGFLYFVDRTKDMIKSAGENISAGEIERVVGEHPGISECAAVGVPDPIRDEVILLVAVARLGKSPNQEEIIDWCRARLSPFKVPSAVTFVDTLPRTSVGKIRKIELRALHGSR